MIVAVCEVCGSRDVFVSRNSSGEPGHWSLTDKPLNYDIHACGKEHAREIDERHRLILCAGECPECKSAQITHKRGECDSIWHNPR